MAGNASSNALPPHSEAQNKKQDKFPKAPAEPLGLVRSAGIVSTEADRKANPEASTTEQGAKLIPPYKATSLALVDRLTARDRAYGLLSGLTKSGPGWNYSEAWFTLARAHEESDQPDKAKEVLWWCVELEESMGVRGWDCVVPGGYVL